MSEHLLRITREELQSPNVVQLSQQKFSSTLNTVTRILSRLHELNTTEKEAVYGVLKRMRDDVELLTKVRLVKAVVVNGVSPESIDAGVLEVLQALVKAEEVLLSPLTVRHGNKIAYLFNKNCELYGKLYRKNELALLEPKELVLAYIYGCGEVLEEPFFKFYRRKVSK